MIFDQAAVNMEHVHRMTQMPDRVMVYFNEGSVTNHVTAYGTTIDDILTAMAAGQSRVATSPVSTPAQLQPLGEPMRPIHYDDGRQKRPRLPGNDPQAMKSIGRRP